MLKTELVALLYLVKFVKDHCPQGHNFVAGELLTVDAGGALSLSGVAEVYDHVAERFVPITERLPSFPAP